MFPKHKTPQAGKSLIFLKLILLKLIKLFHCLNVWKDIIGTKPPFDNSVFLSEKHTAHRNIALTHLMYENEVFPENTIFS